ncbi:MAG: histone H1 [Planctomycetes bacterium]|nr:histone H1 [Planctomycetota bacterium]
MAKKKRPADVNRLAKSVVDDATSESCDDDHTKAAAGRKGGIRGGKARAESLTPEKRSEIAKKAAEARWNKGDD